MYKYIFILTFSVFSFVHLSAQTTDTTVAEESEPPKKEKHIGGHQFTIGFDLLNPVLNQLVDNRYTYEGELTYYLKNEFYAVLEGGWGGSNVNYADLQYTSTNSFARLGFNKSILYREHVKDWDMMFLGLRVAAAGVNRGAANYVITDSLWGNVAGISDSRRFAAVWAEVTTGMRVELLRGMMMGWNLRMKFLMNGRSFQELAPMNIGGFGRGDKNSNIDFNLYLTYAIRWNRKQSVPPPSNK